MTTSKDPTSRWFIRCLILAVLTTSCAPDVSGVERFDDASESLAGDIVDERVEPGRCVIYGGDFEFDYLLAGTELETTALADRRLLADGWSRARSPDGRPTWRNDDFAGFKTFVAVHGYRPPDGSEKSILRFSGYDAGLAGIAVGQILDEFKRCERGDSAETK
jgi:hypothetical protein